MSEESRIEFDQAWELWERVKHRTKDGFVPDTSQRIDVLYSKVPAIMNLLRTQHEALSDTTDRVGWEDNDLRFFRTLIKSCTQGTPVELSTAAAKQLAILLEKYLSLPAPPVSQKESGG